MLRNWSETRFCYGSAYGSRTQTWIFAALRDSVTNKREAAR
jgi:hypothetical protein